MSVARDAVLVSGSPLPFDQEMSDEYDREMLAADKADAPLQQSHPGRASRLSLHIPPFGSNQSLPATQPRPPTQMHISPGAIPVSGSVDCLSISEIDVSEGTEIDVIILRFIKPAGAPLGACEFESARITSIVSTHRSGG